ncbi:MAG: trypsin-like peptidase domain-containing protein [bacterium]
MKWKFKWQAATALLAGGIITAAHADLQCAPPSDQAMSAVVRIVGDGVEGSGVVIDRNRVLTAAHVIEGLDHIQTVRSGLSRSANVIAVSPEKDLALLLVDTGKQKPLRLSNENMLPLSPVWAVGYPLGGPEVATSGKITAYENADVQTTASVDHGQSGGGLVGCEEGQHVLAGMVRAFGAMEKGGELVRLSNYSVSVHSEEIRDFVIQSSRSAEVLERFIYGYNSLDSTPSPVIAQR